ncbi:MAG: TauD/TfdA family dioxygenase, partial [Leptospiraceae bacterium]|nr:TauD/TfdA family dioxygenase [Leptospiraceae bacterium]
MENQNDLLERRRFSEQMKTEQRSIHVFDAGENLSEEVCRQIRAEYEHLGGLHICNTGLKSEEELLPFMDALGFSKLRQFSGGGRTSTQWQEKWVVPGLRRMDYYPPDLYLLPNNEVQYQRYSPRDILFFCKKPAETGGRSFLHEAKRVERFLIAKGGKKLLDKLDKFGLTIETGFLDNRHPKKSENYFASWQERFQTEDPSEALAIIKNKQDEYDEGWWNLDDGEFPSLMTKITLSAYKTLGKDKFLRFPRIALGEANIQNGYRRYLLGNAQEMTDEEKTLLFEAYDKTKEGIQWQFGDIILFDNIRYGHSREAFEGEREIWVGMAGMVWDDRLKKEPIPIKQNTIHSYEPQINSQHYYRQPINVDKSKACSMRIFDAKEKLSERTIHWIREEFALHGALHIINTGLNCSHPGELPFEIQAALGFSTEEQFIWGGSNSGRTMRKHWGNGVYATDYYPPELFLLPHNEILYQLRLPTRLLFFSTHPAKTGGRTFVHSAKGFEEFLLNSGNVGIGLIEKMYQHGFRIDTGFLDDKDPQKKFNYFRSWQERFQTQDREEALSKCRKATDQFDDCCWKTDFDKCDEFPMLMTRIHVPAVLFDNRMKENFLLFPRIALDPPHHHNGFREYLFGNGEKLSKDEINLLLSSFMYEAEARYTQSNDIILVDNIRYGHSREGYSGKREVGVLMAGLIHNEGA